MRKSGAQILRQRNFKPDFVQIEIIGPDREEPEGKDFGN